MAGSEADVINLDLEDSVSPSDKDAARANVIAAINDVDWGKKTLSVRINGLDTPFWYRDVVDLLEQGGERLDLIMIPKAGNAKDLYAVDALVSATEAAKGRSKRLGFEAIIETAAGFSHVQEIAAASPRLESLHLGAADFAASMGMATTGIGGTQDGYYVLPPKDREGDRIPAWGDPWHAVVSAIVSACRTHGVLPVEGPFGDFSDDDGYIAQARRVNGLLQFKRCERSAGAHTHLTWPETGNHGSVLYCNLLSHLCFLSHFPPTCSGLRIEPVAWLGRGRISPLQPHNLSVNLLGQTLSGDRLLSAELLLRSPTQTIVKAKA